MKNFRESGKLKNGQRFSDGLRLMIQYSWGGMDTETGEAHECGLFITRFCSYELEMVWRDREY